ncbi:hypothetical protein [Salinibacter ruber]|uniref:hypothetical protein n=1 Tax=Salinibacter ruber TaxID=146919 RepID=UPI0016112BBF|nr:hypothetical protein [Salinibacter ruber]MBB4089591.1 hypothetical protein [Salinibacter ruber]
MDYRKYRSRREGAGPKRFILVKYWEPDRMKVRELAKGPSAEKPIEELHYPVQDVNPAKQHRTVDAEGDEAGWDWDDQIAQIPISRSRAHPQNKEEMLRADNLLDRRHRELEDIPDDTPGETETQSDIHFLRAVKVEFWLWFSRSDLEIPVDFGSDDPRLSGYEYAEELYDYLDLSSTPPDETGYKHLTDVYEAVSEDRPAAFIISYNGLNKALKKAKLYPTDQGSNRSNHEKLTVLLKRITDYVENKRPE